MANRGSDGIYSTYYCQLVPVVSLNCFLVQKMSISAGIIVFEGKFLPEVVRQGRKYLPVDAVVAVMFPRVPRHVDPIDIFRELAGVQLHRATWSETRVLQSIEGVSHGKPREGTSPLVLFEDLQRCYPELCRICKRYCSQVDKTREEDCGQQTMQANERDGAKSRDSEKSRAKRKFDNLSTVNNNSGKGETSLSTGASKADRSADLEPNAESVERKCNIGVENKDTAVDIAVDTPQQSNHITNKKENAKHKSPSDLSTIENKASPSDDVRWVVVDEVTAESESSFVLAVGSCESIDDTPSPLTEPNHSRPVSKTDSCEEDRFSDLPGKEEERPEEFTSHQTVTDVSAPLNCSPTGEALCGVGMQTYPLCTTQTGGEQKDRDDCSDPAVQDSPPGPHLSHSPKPEASVGETPGGSCQLKDSGDTGKRHVLGETPNTRADGRHLQEKTFPDPEGNASVTKDLGQVAEPPGSFIQHTDHRGNETTSSSVTNSLPPPRRDCEESQKPVVVAHLHSKADKAEASTDSSTDSRRDSQPAGRDARQAQQDRNLWSSLEMLDVCCRTGGNIEGHQGRSLSSGPEDEGGTARGNIATLLRNNGVTLPDVSPPRSSGEVPRSCESANAGGRLVKEERRMTDLQVSKKETRNMATTAEKEDKGTASDATASSEMTGNGERYGLTINRPVSSLELKHDENKPNDCRGSCNESTDYSGGENIGLIMECVPEPTYTKARFKVPQENATKKTTEVEDCAAAKRWDIAPGSTAKGSRSPSDDQPKREVHKALPSPTETVDGPFPPAQNSSTRCTATTTQDPILTGNPILATLLVESMPRGSTPPSDASPGLNSSPPKDTCNPMSRRDVQPTTAMSVQGSVSTNPSATAHQPPANGVATSPSKNSLSRSPNKQPGAVARPAVGNGDRKAAHLGKVELNKKSVDVVQVGTAFYCRATAVSTGVPSFTSSMLKKLCPIFGVEYISVDQVRAGVMSCFESLGYSQIRCLNFLGARTWRLFALLSFLETAFCKVDRKERPTTETAIRLAREAVSLKVMSNNDLVVRGHAVLIYYRSGGAYIPVKEFQRIYPRMSIDCLMETCAELNVTVALGPPAVVRAIGDTVTTLSSASPDLDDFQVVTVSLDLRDLTKLLVRLENIPETRLQRPQPSAEENPVSIQGTQMNVAASTSDSSATKPKCPPPSIEKPVPTSAMKMEVMEVTSDDIAGPKLIRNTTPSVVAGSVGQGPARKATASPTVDEPANPTASTKHAGRADDSRASINPSPSNHTAGKCASLRKLRISSSLPISTQERPKVRHVGPSDANAVVTPTQPLETVPINCNQDMNHRESAASLEMQPLCSNTIPTHVTEADKPSKPRGVTKELLGVRVTSDGRIGTMESAAATTLVKTTQSTAQSTSNDRKVIGVTTQHRPVPEPRGDTGNTAELVQATIATNTTIGVTVQHRSVPEPRGDTDNTAEPVQATVATQATVGDIPKDTMAYPPPQDARHCQRGVVDIADQKGSAAGPENQSLCSNTLPANVPEDDKPSKPRGISKELLGVTSDGQIGTTPPATETIPVKATAAQSASNGCKTTTIGVTVQHRPVPEPCGDTDNTAEPAEVTVATKSTVGDIPEDKTVYPPQQDARHCHNGVVDIPDQRVNQKGSAASPENQSLCSNTLPARVTEADKLTSDGRIGTMPSAAESTPVETTAAQSASNGCKTTTIRRFVCPVPEPYSYGDTGNTAELSQATVATKSTVGLTAEDMTGHPPQQDARHCQHGVVEIAERKPSASVLLSLLTSTKAGNVQRPPIASRPEETPDVPKMCRGRETPEAVDSSVALDLTVRKEPAPVVTGSRYTYERQEGSTGPYRYQTASDPVRKMCSNDATSRQAGATGEKTTPPKPSQQQIKSEPGVSTCVYVESANSSMRHSRLPDFAENAQQGGSRPQHPYPSQAQITSQTSIMSTERSATVGEPRSSVSPLDELQTCSGNVDKFASSSPPNSAAFGPPRYVPTGVAQKRYASPPLHHLNEVQTFSGNVSPSPSNAAASGPPHYNPTGAVPPLHSRHDVQTFSGNVDELTSSSIPKNFGAPNVGIPAGFVTRKRKGSPVEVMANVPSKRKSPCELMGNYAVQQQQGQGEKFCQEGLSSRSVCSPSTITGHVRQAVGPTQGVISDAIYKKNDMRRLQLTWESCGPVDGVPRDKAQEKFPVVIVFEQMKVALTSDFVSLFPHVTLTDFMKAIGGIGMKICPCPASVKEWFMQVGKEDAACSTVVKLGFESVSYVALLLSKQFSQQRCYTSSNENTCIGNNITNATAENIRVSSTGHANCYRRSNDRHQMSTPPYGSEMPNGNNPPAVPRSAVRAPPSPLVLESPEDSSSGLQIVAVQSLATGEGYSMVGNQQRVSTEGMSGSVQRDTSQQKQHRAPAHPPRPSRARMESVQGPYQHPVSSSSQQPYYPPPPPPVPATYQSNNSGVPIVNLQTWSQVRTVEYWQQHATERNHQPSTVPGLAYLSHATYTGLRTGWNH